MVKNITHTQKTEKKKTYDKLGSSIPMVGWQSAFKLFACVCVCIILAIAHEHMFAFVYVFRQR